MPDVETERDLTDLKAMPKVDLHRHLEGSIRLQTIIDLARESGVELPAQTPEELAPFAQVHEPLASLEEALTKFAIAQNSFRTYEAVRRIAREAVEDLAADNVRLAELRYSPDFLCSPGDLDWDRTLDAILRGIDDASGEDVAVGLIAIASRDFGMESARRTVEWTIAHQQQLAGFDIAGPERGFPPRLYTDVVAPLKDTALGLTTHYGESGPPDYPREAVEILATQRLGHGVSVAHNQQVTDLMGERGVTLEMCPTSNVLTHAVPTAEDHPARRLLRAGLNVTVNTDNPGLFGIELTDELVIARDRLGFTDEEIRTVTANALDASFLPDDIKKDVRNRHFSWVG
jgi:adenosine deaminase